MRFSWTSLSSDVVRTLHASLRNTDVALESLGPRIGVEAATSALPFFESVKLVRLVLTAQPEEGPLPAAYALWSGRGPLLVLDGTAGPVHAANAEEGLTLTADDVREYVRFFCLAVRGPKGPFRLLEPSSEVGAPPAVSSAAPLELLKNDPQGRFRVKGIVGYQGRISRLEFAVASDGGISVEDEEPLADPSPADVPMLMGDLEKSAAVFARCASLTPLRTLVELLLEQALRAKERHRLLEAFNASRGPESRLDSFSAMVIERSPVVAIESSMPFVEETIAEIVVDRCKPPTPFRVQRAAADGGDPSVAFVRGSVETPGILLLPLQVYRTISDLQRVAFNIASRDVSVLITCERLDRLPEALRNLVDLTIRLPRIDTAIFEKLFTRSIGPLPADWQAADDSWVRHCQHTDFEQPRRNCLPVMAALEYVRTSVQERMAAVQPTGARKLKDLHGLGEARQFAEDLIADIHAAMRGEIPWSQVDSGALIVGPPGTGKTTLAKAIAADCGVRFVHASATEWQSSGDHIGHHIAAIRRTFAEARDFSPSIVFIDEIDSVGNRQSFSGSSAQYLTEVVNALLEQIQGIDPEDPVIVLGATNSEEGVDLALRRSGRLDRVLRVPRPNSEALSIIYGQYLAALCCDTTVDARILGRLSLGLTGADVERIVRGAARRARKERRTIGQRDILAEITNKPRDGSGLRLSPAEIERTATHEAGHALAIFLGQSKGADIGFVSIVPRADGTLGFVAPLPNERQSLTRRDYQDTLDICLAGRAAEEVRYGEEGVSGGASHDLNMATTIATNLIARLGLRTPRKLITSDALNNEDAAALEALLEDSYKRTLRNLIENRTLLLSLATTLGERQELTGDEVQHLLLRCQYAGDEKAGSPAESINRPLDEDRVGVPIVHSEVATKGVLASSVPS